MSCMLVYVFDMFHILLSADSLRDLWNVYMYVCNKIKVGTVYLPLHPSL